MSRPHFPKIDPSPLRRERLRHVFTLEQLSAAAGISLPYTAALETARRGGTAATWERLAAALHVPVNAIRSFPARGLADLRQLELGGTSSS